MRDITNALRRKLNARLERRAAARPFTDDVMLCIERDTARLEYFHRERKWPADMSVAERERLETDLELIIGSN
jgi:hypothetical protein